ncbi:receptor-like serine/threonine-protein kinase ALE2 isoform X2 [Phalaenopsis equestris]|uniref:receptor-like serine/threonine-protein kinase ALE2 isoform X2 n=1 Tax=Phalaenopsis equestris TaxID=78828 RepID=UPI0009E2B2F8|nr:receptor-like serine/threonine-protein kinase ALE2 isoform X2 [Phalaenopsis equestris]
MRVLLLLLCLLPLGVASNGLQYYFLFRSKPRPMKPMPVGSTIAPSSVPGNWAMAPWAPRPSPAFPPRHSGKAEKHARAKKHHTVSPSPYSPPKENCDKITCSDPFTRTPIGSPCGCVYPIKVVIDVGVAPILLFPQIAELEIEVAAGTFLKQSQVRIMGADASIYNQDKTTISIYLVPLGEKFDKMTALIIYDRFWQKKVRISESYFGDYQVISVHYPGLPSSPPPMPWGSSGINPSGSQQYPFRANIRASKKQSLNDKIIVLVSLSSFLLISVFIGVGLIILKFKKLDRMPTTTSSAGAPLTKRSGTRTTIQSSVASSTSMSLVSTMATYPSSVKTFLLSELEKATNRFSSERMLGEGGYGRVYLGILENGDEVAVKLLTRKEQNGDREFIGEVEMLSRLHHRNLVKLIGICIEGHKRCLVYELVRNGSVESHLHGADRDKQKLNWDARMKIALGAARGLAYLHEDSNPRVIHRDFKASNVLLEEDFTPKVSDFGLAKEASDASHHISTRVMGTFGYVAPEYAMTGHLLVKSDVYSYGVVLLELITGRKPVYMTNADEPENLVTCARPLLTTKEGLEKLIDPSLQGICEFDDFARVAAVASMCIHTEASQRPFMGEVVQALKLIYNDMDETNEDSYSQRGSSSCQDCDFKGDFGLEYSWWSGGSPCINYGNSYSLVNMEYSSDRIQEMRRPHSTSSLADKFESLSSYNRSGPLRTKRKKFGLHRLRNTRSEHGITKKHLHLNG